MEPILTDLIPDLIPDVNTEINPDINTEINPDINTDINTDINIESIEQIIYNFSRLQIKDISSFEMTVNSSDNIIKPKKFIIAIDNDECIGSWADISLLYNILKTEFKKEPDINLFTQIMLKTGCVRPYVKDFFEMLLELKKKNIIYKIFMFTAASNSIGWVSFLSKILENWLGQKLYDGIIHQEMIEEWHLFNKSPVTNDTGYIKNMNMIREIIDFYDEVDSRDFNIIAVDDRPTNITNGIAIGVSPFKVAVNLFEVIRIFVPKDFDYLVDKYNKTIDKAWVDYMKNPKIFTNVSLDNDILKSMDCIDKIISSNN